MHEFSIAAALLERAVEAAEAQDARRITAVSVELGALQLVDPDALEMAFTAVSDGTLAAGARLEMREVPPRAVCRQCGTEYTAEVDNYACPQCRAAVPRFVAGNDILLTSVELVTGEEERSDGETH